MTLGTFDSLVLCAHWLPRLCRTYADPVLQSDCTCNCSCRCICRPSVTGMLVPVPESVPADHLRHGSLVAVSVTVLIWSLYLLIMSHKVNVNAFAVKPAVHSPHKVECVVLWLHRLHMLSRSGLQQAHGQDSFCHAQAKPTNCRSSQVLTASRPSCSNSHSCHWCGILARHPRC